MNILSINGYNDIYKYVYILLMLVNLLIEPIVFPRGPWREFYLYHTGLIVVNIVAWCLYKSGRAESLSKTAGFLGERVLSFGRILMCFLAPIGFFPYSPVSGVLWFPIIEVATSWNFSYF